MIFNTIEFKVGFLVVAVVVMVFSLSVLISKGPGLFESSKIIVFDVDDASGLIKNGAVKAYGISVGVIKDIRLIDRRARVYLNLSKSFRLTESASVRVRHQGILGDRYIEILMGHPDDPLLEDGDSIKDVRISSNVEGILNLAAESVVSIKDLAQVLKEAFDGKEGQVDESPSTLKRILREAEVFMANLNHLSSENFDRVDKILKRLDRMTVKFDEFASAGSGIENLEASIKNVEEITTQVNEGKGTLGRLIYEDETLDKINQVATNMNEYLGDVSKLRTSFDFHTEYLQRFGNFKSFFSFKVKPGLDRYYELKLISDSEGVVEKTSTRRSSNNSPEEKLEEEKSFKNKLKLSALMAKSFYDFTLKAGLIENSAGLGVDYHLWNKKLKLALELYNISQTNMRAFMRFNLIENFYIIGGGNNIFSKEKDMSPFIGAGLFITNDDIKTLVSKVSF